MRKLLIGILCNLFSVSAFAGSTYIDPNYFVGYSASCSSQLIDLLTNQCIATGSSSGTVTSVSATVPAGFSVSGSPITGSGTLAISIQASQAISASAIAWNTGSLFSKTLSGNTTFTFSGQVDGQTIVVKVTNTTGNFTVTWPTVSWPNGSAPVQTVGAHTDIYTFVDYGGTISGTVVQNF